jgi:hypothetical protein
MGEAVIVESENRIEGGLRHPRGSWQRHSERAARRWHRPREAKRERR